MASDLSAAGNVQAVILAAGEGRRLGFAPKATLRFGAQTALELVLGAAFEGGCGQAVVVLGAFADEVRPLVPRDPRVQVVDNPQWAAGQSGSLVTGLRALETNNLTGVLLFPVDYPRVPAMVVAALLDVAAGCDPTQGWRIVPTFSGQHGHPIVFSPAHIPALLGLEPGADPRPILRGGATLTVPVESEFILRDVDTPEDYAALQ